MGLCNDRCIWFLLAFFMERNTAKSQILEEKLRGPRMIPRSETCFCLRKIKALQEKQDYEIYNATVKERNRIARKSTIMWDMYFHVQSLW